MRELQISVSVLLGVAVLASGLRAARAAPPDAGPAPTAPGKSLAAKKSLAGTKQALSPEGEEPKDRAKARVAKTPGALAGRRFGPDLVGRWTLVLPAGFRRPMTVKRLAKDRFRLLGPADIFTGVYEVRDRKFVIVVPDDKRLTEFQFRIDNANLLKLIAQPPVRKTGSDYSGATLERVLEKPKK